jgi:hypothetical protein
VVEGSGLENRQGCKPLVGSNPTPSANFVNTLIFIVLFQALIARPFLCLWARL